jgi:hypothetical protein
VDYLNTINAEIAKNTGKTLNDLSFGFDGNGNITATLAGVGTGSANLNDLLSEALKDPAVQEGLGELGTVLAGSGIDLGALLGSLNLAELAAV